ncbi:hypothetical protein RclHR1_17620001 [Rhizophagus clarus]|uniref:Uncharacterized protein n=1 Tax=Rhizophagus clarus TaxID=94130 RepID=A0A2Z6R0Y8_9GLOM|nr:hypothetical protein RclHR1_17620001 [Rhizophagus clarus]GES94429.1 hypothetical protein GLOIN_2v1486819 [Rhizophagus clarus]
MRNNGFIIEDVLFYENTVESIDSLITSYFPLVKKRDYILLNGSTSKLKAATNQEKSLKNFRDNMSKSNKRLYLALKSNNSNETLIDKEEVKENKSNITD